MDPEVEESDGTKHTRAKCSDFDIEGKLLQPFKQAQLKDGRERKTLIFYNGAFGGHDFGGSQEAEEYITSGKSDAIVYGVDSMANPDLPFRIFNHIELHKPDYPTFCMSTSSLLHRLLGQTPGAHTVFCFVW